MNANCKTQIIIDSTTDLAEEFNGRATVVPLIVSFGEQEYLDGIDLTRNEFYEKLIASDILPKTSQASPLAFDKVYKEVRESGCDAIVITIASKLSGTYQSACIAAEDYPEISVIDSENVAIGTGILAQYAILCAEKGLSRDEIIPLLEKKRNEICLLAMLDTLDYLMKGGRISKVAAFAGGMLNIKPVITVKDGEIHVLGKARGGRKANNFLIEQIKASGIRYDEPLLLGYSGTSDELLGNYIEDSSELWRGHIDKLDSAQICSVVGTHVGPGAIAVAFFKNEV